MGKTVHHFQTTHWTLVLSADTADKTIVAKECLNKLCETYWSPLYTFVRSKGFSVNDSEDMVQSFFHHFIHSELIKNVDQNKGLFRTYLLTCLKNYMLNDIKKSNAQKRGGHVKMFAIDAEQSEDRFSVYEDDSLSPERLFDRSWAMTVLDNVLKTLEEDYRMEDKEELFKVLKDSLVSRKGTVSRSEQAKKLGMTESAVKVAVHRLRKRYKNIFREIVSNTVQHENEVEDEIKELFKAIQN